MPLYLNSSTIDALERRLRNLPGPGPNTPPTVAEIVAAANGAGGSLSLARARSWAVGALHRVGADAGTIIGMLIAAEAASRGLATAFAPVHIVPAPSEPAEPVDTPPEPPDPAEVTYGGEPLIYGGEQVEYT